MTFHKGKCTYAEIMDSRRIQIHISCRCNVKDVAVEVPVPDNTIPDFIIPSHIVVPRCTGMFLSRSNLIQISQIVVQDAQVCSFPISISQSSHIIVACTQVCSFPVPISKISHIVVPRCTGVFLTRSNLIDLSYRCSQMHRYVPFLFQSHRYLISYSLNKCRYVLIRFFSSFFHIFQSLDRRLYLCSFTISPLRIVHFTSFPFSDILILQFLDEKLKIISLSEFPVSQSYHCLSRYHTSKNDI